MTSRQSIRTCRDFLKLLHYRTGRGQESSPERIRVALFARVHHFIDVQHFRLSARRKEVPGFVCGRLRPPLSRMIGIQQDAWSQLVVIREQARYVAVKSSDIDADAYFHFQQRNYVTNWRVSETEAFS